MLLLECHDYLLEKFQGQPTKEKGISNFFNYQFFFVFFFGWRAFFSFISFYVWYSWESDFPYITVLHVPLYTYIRFMSVVASLQHNHCKNSSCFLSHNGIFRRKEPNFKHLYTLYCIWDWSLKVSWKSSKPFWCQEFEGKWKCKNVNPCGGIFKATSFGYQLCS